MVVMTIGRVWATGERKWIKIDPKVPSTKNVPNQSFYKHPEDDNHISIFMVLFHCIYVTFSGIAVDWI